MANPRQRSLTSGSMPSISGQPCTRSTRTASLWNQQWPNWTNCRDKSFIIISSHLLYSTFLYFFNPPISHCTTLTILTIKVDHYLHYRQSTQNIISRNDADDSKSSISIIFFAKQRKNIRFTLGSYLFPSHITPPQV